MAQTITTVITIVGCQYRVNACDQMGADPQWFEHLHLKFDPDNEYDSKAIAVEYKDMLVGYVSKKTRDNVWDFLEKGVQPTTWKINEAKFTPDPDCVLQWVEFEVTF